jgi:hypothetical protein
MHSAEHFKPGASLGSTFARMPFHHNTKVFFIKDGLSSWRLRQILCVLLLSWGPPLKAG